MTPARHGAQSSPLDEAKRALRARVLARLKNEIAPALRQAYASGLRRRAAAALQEEAESRFGGKTSLQIALYAPMEHEVDLLPLLERCPQHKFYFPRCMPGRILEFCRIRRPDRELVPDRYGIRAPRPDLRAIAPSQLDFVFVPGVAFTPDGHRLGYGGGYYDRFLPRCPQAVTLACLFPEQLVATLPMGRYDRPVSRLLVAEEPADCEARSAAG